MITAKMIQFSNFDHQENHNFNQIKIKNKNKKLNCLKA